MAVHIQAVNFVSEDHLDSLIANIIDSDTNRNSYYPYWIYRIDRNEDGSGTLEYTA